MEILIDDIAEEGLELEASEKDPWFKGAVQEALGEAFDEADHAKVLISLDRIDGNVNIDGTIEIVSHPVCDRCLVQYEVCATIPFHTVLAPLYENKRQQELEGEAEAELIKEDLEFGFYEGDRFDVSEVIREQIVLAEPMKHLCKEDCKGLCPRCGKNLNKGPCTCSEEHQGTSFVALKDVRIEKH
ncbi:MAG: DUF177 domain-containing protein [Pseudomonadota bacterium]